MKAGSMEGLIGASINMKLTRTPMRVFKEAERRGDTETMERAMGYVTDFRKEAHECSDRAQEELAKELREECKEQEIRRKQALENKEDAKEYVEKVQEKNGQELSKTDRVEISEEGKTALKNNSQTEKTATTVENTDVKLYTDEGKPKVVEPSAETDDKKIDVSV